MLAERPRAGGQRPFFPSISSAARARISGATKTHLLKCGTIDWAGFPEIGGVSVRATVQGIRK